MTIKEAIKIEEKTVKLFEDISEVFKANADTKTADKLLEYIKMEDKLLGIAEEHRDLVKWLKKLKKVVSE